MFKIGLEEMNLDGGDMCYGLVWLGRVLWRLSCFNEEDGEVG